MHVDLYRGQKGVVTLRVHVCMYSVRLCATILVGPFIIMQPIYTLQSPTPIPKPRNYQWPTTMNVYLVYGLLLVVFQKGSVRVLMVYDHG